MAHPAYRPDIDGLRAVAVVPVVLFHAFPDLIPGGFVGVDVFFVISGYLISSIVFNELQDGRFGFLDFYSRRLRRIFPALILTLLATVGLSWLTLLQGEFHELTKHVWASATFWQNLALLSEAGYFDRASDLKPLLHLWSLSVEEQFYIFFPLVAVLLFKTGWSGLALAILALVSFWINIYTVSRDPAAAFYLPQTRAWELLAGVLLARATITFGAYRIPTKLRETASLAGIGLIALAMATYSSETQFPGWHATVPVIGAVCLIASGPQSWINQKILSLKPLVFIGLISYPLYLWHWPLIAFLRIPEGQPPSVEFQVVAVLMSLVLAILTYRVVELPLRGLARSGKSSLITVALAVAMILTAGLGAIGAAGYWDKYRPDTIALNIDNFAWEGIFENSACREMYPQLRQVKFCNLSLKTAPTVALVGDSHAMVYYQGLAPLVVAQGGNLLNLGGGSCMPSFDAPFNSTGLQYSPNGVCHDAMNASLDLVEQTEEIGVVVLGMRRLLQIIEPSQTEAMKTSLSATVRRFLSANKKVVILLDFPELDVDPVACVRPLGWPGVEGRCQTREEGVQRNRKTQEEIIQAIAGDHAALVVFDPLSYLCSEGVCPVVLDGKSLYLDRDHLSPDGSRFIAPKLAELVLDR